MAEYIEREAALNVINENKSSTELAWISVSKIPAADVAPVRHGEWKYEPPTATLNGAWKCTACKHYFWGHTANEFKYCPNCGARMRGGTE